MLTAVPPRRRDAHERLERMIDETVRTTWSRFDFEWGIRQLTGLGQHFGYLNHARGGRLLAKQQLQLSLLNVHLGRTTTASAHAQTAEALYEELNRAVKGREAVEGALESLAALAHAYLLAHRPAPALRLLAKMESLHRQHRIPMLPEFFRKRGVGFLQLATSGCDAEARRAFDAAAQAPAQGDDPLEHKMMSGRHLALLNIDCDAAGLLAREAEDQYGSGSLQRSMCVHWSAATALTTDSPTLHQSAYEALAQNAIVAAKFGHQATVGYLLRNTDAFRIPRRFRREWVRVALYSNAFRGE